MNTYLYQDIGMFSTYFLFEHYYYFLFFIPLYLFYKIIKKKT